MKEYAGSCRTNEHMKTHLSKRNLLLATAAFILLLTALRCAWLALHAVPEHPAAVRGFLDLRGWEFDSQKAITLDGEWEFYPNALLMPQPASAPDASTAVSYIRIPGNWGGTQPPAASSPSGYGTYRLRIAVDPAADRMYGLRLPGVRGSSELYINGKLHGYSGKPAADKKQAIAGNVPYSAQFEATGGEIEIVVQAANLENGQGGIVRPIRFGSAAAIGKEAQLSYSMQLAAAVVLLMHAVYGIALYSIATRQKGLIVFSLLMLFAALLPLLDENGKLLLVWLPIDAEWGARLLALSGMAVPALLLELLRYLLPSYMAFPAFRRAAVAYAACGLFCLLAPMGLLYQSAAFIYILVSAALLLFPWIALRAALKGEADAVYLLLGTVALANSALWSLLRNVAGLEIGYYPFDVCACCLAFAAFWFRRCFRTAAETARLAEQLEQANKRKDDFLANTSHELRNPLHGMLTIAQTVLEREKLALDQKSADDIGLLVSVGQRMSFMLNDLLDLSRLQESGIRLRLESVRMQAVASGTLEMIRFMTEGKPIRLLNQIPERLPAVLADENRLVQIVFNLLHNAVKFTQEGTVSIRAFVQQGKAVIRIADTGIGMDEKTLRRIFLPYEQGDPGVSGVGGGLGLGLSICKQLVELHGGVLEAVSAPGGGSAFSFALPLAELHSAGREQAADWPGGGAAVEASARTPIYANETAAGAAADRLCILAVDDDPVNLNVLTDILPAEAYEIVTAASGNEALSLLEARDWDLIVADISMPHMSGYALTRLVRERFSLSELPVLLLTARGRPEDVEAGFRSGANDYIAKPMDALELRARVRALTSMKRSVRERLRIEAACLQAQIQPHFLFNTLNSIAALSEIDMTRMRVLLGKFGQYLRASFDSQNSERLVPLSHELKLVRSYLFIEKERFEDRLEIEWEVDERLQLKLPPLSIQPLVENAVKHGILARSQGGKLLIRITDRPGYAEVEVVDNGVGMDNAVRERLLVPEEGERAGIGLRNTDRRLKQLYGKGLHIISEPGLGTTVRFTVLKGSAGK